MCGKKGMTFSIPPAICRQAQQFFDSSTYLKNFLEIGKKT
jgi:hypothetical protein